MTVFKKYFQIVKSHIGFIIMYSAIAIGIAVVNTSYQTTTDYIDEVSKVAIINNDNSALTDNFIEYMDKNTELKEVENDPKVIQDTLYDNKVDAILIIPENFSEDLKVGLKPNIEIKKSAQSYSTMVELLTNRYFKAVNAFSSVGMNDKEIISRIEEDLSKEVKVEVESKNDNLNNMKLAIFYSFENYAFLSIFIFIIGTIMCIFNEEKISKRNSISKMKPSNLSKQLYLGHLSLTLVIWAIFILISIILYKDLMFSKTGLLFVLNSFIFAITSTSLAFMIGTLVKNKSAVSGIQIVLGLGLSFISGCFISSELLDPNIVNFSKIFPSYWFIDNNYAISKLSDFSMESLKPIYLQMLLVLGFGILFLIISTIVIKKKARKN